MPHDSTTLQSWKRRKAGTLVPMAAIFAFFGIIALGMSQADTQGIGLEAEAGGIILPAKNIADPDASIGQAVRLAHSTATQSDCLQRSAISVVSGTVSSDTATRTNGSTVDARNYTVASPSDWLVTPRGGANICWLGGVYKNTIADAGTGTPTNAWDEYWHHSGGFTLKNNNTGWIFDSVYVHHTGDAFNITQTGGDFEIRHSRIADIRDDCVQNDYYLNGYIHDNYFEGCYSGFSSKATEGETPDGTDMTMTIANNVIYLAPTWSVYKGDSPGSGYLIKWAKPGDGLGKPERLVFKDNVVRVDMCPFKSGSGCGGTFYFPPDAEWSNNSLYWGGPGSPPAELAAMFGAAKNSRMITEAEWNAAVANWNAAHPDVN